MAKAFVVLAGFFVGSYALPAQAYTQQQAQAECAAMKAQDRVGCVCALTAGSGYISSDRRRWHYNNAAIDAFLACRKRAQSRR